MSAFTKSMKINIIIAFFSIVVGFGVNLQPANAQVARSSAKLTEEYISSTQPDTRREVLKSFFETRNSPLSEHADTFISEADKHNLDWKLVAAIAGNESQFGHLIPPYSNNAWGYGVYGPNVIRFSSWDEGIATVSNALREDYINNWGATNIYEIGSIYAADPAWARKVIHYMTLIEEHRNQNLLYAISISI